MKRFILTLAVLLVFTGCYNRTYFKTIEEVTESFGDLSDVRYKRVLVNNLDGSSSYYFEVRYRPY
jgi:hypothetical protein